MFSVRRFPLATSGRVDPDRRMGLVGWGEAPRPADMITPRMSTRVATNPATSTSPNLPASLFAPGNNKRTLDHAQQLRDRGFVVLDHDEWRLPAALVEDAVRDPSPRP